MFEELNGKRYSVLLADPPWRYDVRLTPNRRVENHYPTMLLNEIAGMPVDQITANQAMLFLWATNPMLPEALSVMKQWGFTYKTNFVWCKDRMGMGFYVRQQHELLLVGNKGSMPVPDKGSLFASLIFGERTRHSKKPDIVYGMINRMYPKLPKLELFARQAYDNWDCWGLDAPKSGG